MPRRLNQRPQWCAEPQALSSSHRRRDFERLVEEVPSLKDATRLEVEGEWTFGPGVRVVGEASLGSADAPGRVEDTVLGDAG